MAESPTYTTAQIIALPKGTTNWYEYAKSSAQHVKNGQDDISTLQSAAFSGATPGWNAAIDTRWYVADTSSSTTTYTGTTNPTATGSDSLFAGYRIFFNPANTNTGASTLNVSSSDAAVDIKKISGGAKAALAAGDLDDNGIYELVFDGTDWIMVADSGFGDAMALNMQDTILTRPEIKDYAESVNAIGATGGGTQDMDLTLGNVVTATVDTSANTFTFSNPPATGKCGSFTLILTNGGSQTVNWPGAVDWAGGTAPTLTTAGIDVITFTTIDAGTIWYGFAAGLDMG
jgi:hypothetical protein